MDLTTEQLLSEPIETARRREQSAFDEIGAPAQGRMVLFGAGMLGRKVCAALRRHGIEPLAFADNNPQLHGGNIEGVPVFSPVDAATRFGGEAVFVVTISRGLGDEGMAARCVWLKHLGCRWVASFLPLAWKYAADLLPHNGADRPSVILAASAELATLDDLWADDRSRETFRAQLLWRLRGDFSALRPPVPHQYFPLDVLNLRADERFVDGGAFDGDTLRTLGRNFSRAWAIEPDPRNAARLRAAGDPRVTVVECALGRTRGAARFAATGEVASALDETGSATVTVETLDHILPTEDPTFVKLDIEGAELDAIQGGAQLLARCQPIAAVCVYHTPNHLWKIPEALNRNLPGHELILRVHQNDGFELVAYAVPRERRPC